MTLNDRKSDLLIDNINLLTDAFRKVKANYPFKLDALVVLPEHLHAVLTLPDYDYDFSIRWRYIKGLFSRAVKAELKLTNQHLERTELGIWQKRFWEHKIRNQSDYHNHINYCYYNPVKHNLIERVSDWKYSTFHRVVEKGLYLNSWGGRVNIIGKLGE